MTDAAETMKEKLQQRMSEAARRSGQLRQDETCDPETGEILQSPRLHWLDPVRTNARGDGHQLAAGTEYVIRKTMTPDQPVTYWAWSARKLLGDSTLVSGAQQHCEAHYARQPE